MPQLQPEAYLIFIALVLAQPRPNEHKKLKKKHAAAPKEPPRGACSGGAGRLNRIAVEVGDGCSKNTQRLRWQCTAPPWCSDGGGWSKKKKKSRRCGAGDETMAWSVGGVRDGGSCALEVCGTVGAVRDGGAKLRWSSEKGGAVRCRRRNAGLECRRCAGWWELCVGGVLDGGSCAGWWR